MANLFEILAKEQSLGEGHARILIDLGQADPDTFAQGILAYVEAKAAFDALIEGAKHLLIEGRELADDPGLRAKVEGAVACRETFCRLVQERVLGPTEGTKGMADWLEPASWIGALLEGLAALLQELRRPGETRRAQTLAQLDSLKWRPFEALTKPA